MHLTVNGVKLFFEVYGSKLKLSSTTATEKPTLVVLHGGHGFLDHTLYVEFWSQFSDIAQVIFLDQRGCGRSEGADNFDKLNLKQWADDLYEFCQTLEITKPVIAGVSIGGHVMCDFVSRYPDYAGGLIFCNTEAHYLPDKIYEKLHSLGGNKPAEVFRDFYNNPTQKGFENFSKVCIPYYGKNAYSPGEINRCTNKHIEIFLHYSRNELLKFNYLEDMRKIQCPTLLLAGRESLHVPEAAEEMAKKIKPEYLTLKILDNAGGPVYKDQPEKAYNIIKNFISMGIFNFIFELNFSKSCQKWSRLQD